MKKIFWICWLIEMAAVIAWIGIEMKLGEPPHNLYPFVAALYLVLALAVHFAFSDEKPSTGMVMPFALLADLMASKTTSRKAWTQPTQTLHYKRWKTPAQRNLQHQRLARTAV